MKAKEELIELVLDNDFITAPRLRAKFRSLLDKVEIEAQVEFKNCNISLVCNHHKGSSRAIIKGVEHWQCMKCKAWLTN